MSKKASESHAIIELKDASTGIIESNNQDGVAKWLRENTSKKDFSTDN